MNVLKGFKPSRAYGIFVFVLLACLLFYFSTNPIQKTWLWKTQQRIEREELSKVLKAASMSDRTVIVTTLNEAWASPGSVMDLFLESFRIGKGTSRLLNHLVIVAVDQKAYNKCLSIHPHCFSLKTPGVDFSSEKQIMTPDYLKLMWRRIDFLRTILEMGYNFVFTDADIMWFRDPFPFFDSVDIDFQIACDFYYGNPIDKNNRANGGFNYVKSADSTIEFYKYWYMARTLYPDLHDQSVFEIIKNDRIVEMYGLRIKYLNTMYFGGFCEPSKDMNQVCTMHANCCIGLERKVHDLKLILDDWKNFTALESQHNKQNQSSPTKSSSPWSAPSKCNS